MRVALYLRRSTNEVLQADSLEAQAELLQRYAADHSYQIIETYSDSASGKSINGRIDFARLVGDVAKGAAFEAVLVRDVSRWGRFLNIDESAYWEFFFVAHGVRVHYVQEGFCDDSTPYANLMKSLKRVIAAEFSRDKARMVQFGKYRAVKRGFRLGGDPPFGMVRVLVTPEGRRLQVLKRGERKLLNDHRVKLAAGSRKDVQLVVRIFRMYTKEEHTLGEISRTLNNERIPSPRGALWQEEVIAHILTNPAYAGCAAGSFSASQNFAEPQRLVVEGAWPAIVSRSLWDAAQRKLSRRRWLRSPDGLSEQLRAVFERHGVVTAISRLNESGPTQDTFRTYFENGDNDAIRHAYSREIDEIWLSIKAAISERFEILDDDKTILVRGMLRVGYVVAFPRTHRLGRIHWRFDFNGDETQDVTIAVALGPDARPLFFFRLVNRLFRPLRRTVTRHMYSDTTKSDARSLEQILRGLRRDTMRFSGVAKAIFLRHIETLPVVNTQEVERQLGWPEGKGLHTYYQLRTDGVVLPPLLKLRGRRITVRCEICGGERPMRISKAMQRKTSLCQRCSNHSRRKFATCPACGVRRKLGRGELKKLSHGAVSKCRSCNSRALALALWEKRHATRPTTALPGTV